MTGRNGWPVRAIAAAAALLVLTVMLWVLAPRWSALPGLDGLYGEQSGQRHHRPRCAVATEEVELAAALTPTTSPEFLIPVKEEEHSQTGYGKMDKGPFTGLTHESVMRMREPTPCFKDTVSRQLAAVSADYTHLGCYATTTPTPRSSSGSGGIQSCLETCRPAAAFFSMDAAGGCTCHQELPSLGALLAAATTVEEDPDPADYNGVHCGLHGGAEATALFAVGQWPPRLDLSCSRGLPAAGFGPGRFSTTVDVYVYVHTRLASIWLSCRLASLSSRFNYRIHDLRFKVRHEDLVFGLLPNSTNLSVLVLNACCVRGWLLQEWPKHSVLVLTGDESARWGDSHPNGKIWWGPHGPHGPLPTNTARRLVLPPQVGHWFKQYHSDGHAEHYAGYHYFPLGSRIELPDAPPVFKPATLRRYAYSFVGAGTTSDFRATLAQSLTAAIEKGEPFTKEQVFLHLTKQWSTDPNDASKGYINPAAYQKIALDSTFTLCPQGQSIEQFRIYEAIEVGSIPVLFREHGAEERLPPQYLSSPMVFVDDWESMSELLSSMLEDPRALLQRQMDLDAWYKRFMKGKLEEIEHALVARAVKYPLAGRGVRRRGEAGAD